MSKQEVFVVAALVGQNGFLASASRASVKRAQYNAQSSSAVETEWLYKRETSYRSYLMSRIWLHQAAINGDVEALRRELAKGFAVDEYNETGMTLLHSLCSNRPGGDDDPGDRLACFHLLIEAGADPTKRTGAGNWFPLLYAAEHAHTELVAALLATSAQSDLNHERDHLNSLADIFSPKFSCRGLPPEMVRRVVEYAFDVGGH